MTGRMHEGDFLNASNVQSLLIRSYRVCSFAWNFIYIHIHVYTQNLWDFFVFIFELSYLI